MRTIRIKQETPIPGTNYVLEKGDRIEVLEEQITDSSLIQEDLLDEENIEKVADAIIKSLRSGLEEIPVSLGFIPSDDGAKLLVKTAMNIKPKVHKKTGRYHKDSVIVGTERDGSLRASSIVPPRWSIVFDI